MLCLGGSVFPSSSKILVVDDMVQIREGVKRILRDLELTQVIEADNGVKAYELLKDHYDKGRPFQLVISDWNMPEMTGLELLKKVRSQAHWQNLPFVLLTAEAEKSQVTDAILAGVSQYILKPFTPKSIEEKLQGVWAKHNK